MQSEKRSIGLIAVLAIFAASLFMTSTPAVAQAERVLYSFNNNGTDGYQPGGGLISDAAGNLYGTTFWGGTFGSGTVYELSHTQGGWRERVLHNFGSGKDGQVPEAGLILDAVGNLYGTTFAGGIYGYGTVFELTAGGAWREKLLHSFNNVGDGYNPEASLIFDAAGNIYGTTLSGGGSGSCMGGCGTVFELTSATGGGWKEQILHAFTGNGTDGAAPLAGLVFDSLGNLYGTTGSGGAYQSEFDTGGTAFELTPAAGGKWKETILHSFGNGLDGNGPVAGLIFDAAGNLYGTTNASGGVDNDGTVFKLSRSDGGGWKETILHNFKLNGTDGDQPLGSVIFDAAGNLYGTTGIGGTYLYDGTVFELSPSNTGRWREAILHSFGNGTDGNFPTGNMIFDASGNLLGTTATGGAYGFGAVFEIKP
jgi:uncharacterized repeat protein (TIGR03803 family)